MKKITVYTHTHTPAVGTLPVSLLERFHGPMCVCVCVCVCVRVRTRTHSVMSNSLPPHGLCSPPSSSVHVIFQARILEWVDISFSRGLPNTDQTCVSWISCIGRQILYHLYHGSRVSATILPSLMGQVLSWDRLKESRPEWISFLLRWWRMAQRVRVEPRRNLTC